MGNVLVSSYLPPGYAILTRWRFSIRIFGKGEMNPPAQEYLSDGLEAARAKDYVKALQCFLHAYAEDPDSAEVLTNIGFAYFRLGRYQEAFDWLTKSLSLNPNQAKAKEYLHHSERMVDNQKAEKSNSSVGGCPGNEPAKVQSKVANPEDFPDVKKFAKELVGAAKRFRREPLSQPSPVTVGLGRGFGFAIGCVTAAVMGCMGVGLLLSGIDSPSPKSTDRNTLNTPQRTVVSPVSSEDVYLTFFSDNANLTNLQRETLWDNEYKGKTIRWTGTVAQVSSTILDEPKIQIDQWKNDGVSDVSLILVESERTKALSLKSGDTITYLGELDLRGALIFNTSLVNGRIEQVQRSSAASSSRKSESGIPIQSAGIPISISFEEFNSIYVMNKQDLTDYQLQTRFENECKGKVVTWTGTVKSVSDSGGKVKVAVRHLDST